MDKTIVIPGSKSETVRAIIISSLFGGKIINPSNSEDAIAACNVAKSLGAEIVWNDCLNIIPGEKTNINLNIYSSATAFRIGLLSLLSTIGEANITMSEQLAGRDMGKLYEFLQENNIYFKKNYKTLYCRGTLDKNEYSICDDNSSQLLSGILISMGLRRIQGIVNFSNIPSFDYVLLTIAVLKYFDIKCKLEDNAIYVDARKAKYTELKIHSDASSLAPFLAAKALGYKFEIKAEIGKNQADSIFIDILKQMGFCDSKLKFLNTKSIKPITLDCDNFPDIVPFIALLCTQANGASVLKNLYRLKNKESDRINNTVKILNALGANIDTDGNDMIIHGKKETWEGGLDIETYNDHRMLMLAAIASLNCKKTNRLNNCNAVNKSYPKFWEDFIKIGGKYECME